MAVIGATLESEFDDVAAVIHCEYGYVSSKGTLVCKATVETHGKAIGRSCGCGGLTYSPDKEYGPHGGNVTAGGGPFIVAGSVSVDKTSDCDWAMARPPGEGVTVEGERYELTNSV